MAFSYAVTGFYLCQGSFMDRTNAKRQARYRDKKRSAGEFKRINYWLGADVVDRVSAYSSALGWSKMKVLEQMIIGYRLPRTWKKITKKTRRVKLRVKSVARP
jgi:hypothetical protein